MAGSVIFEEQIEIPDIGSLSDFRQWALSDRFPDRGRIDYIEGRIEVDMSPEDLFVHGAVKTEIVRVLSEIVKRENLGYLFTDSSRITAPDADLSAEPDVIFVSSDALDSQRVKLIAKASGEQGRYVEMEGGADLVVEIVSDSSVSKDTRRLPQAYFNAGTTEFWLIDARKDQLLFQIHGRGAAGFESTSVDKDGFQRSSVLRRAFQLERRHDDRGFFMFDLRSTSADA